MPNDCLPRCATEFREVQKELSGNQQRGGFRPNAGRPRGNRTGADRQRDYRERLRAKRKLESKDAAAEYLSECKTKWANLRDSFTNVLREGKTKQSEPSGNQRKKRFKSNDMSFEKGYVHHHQSTSSRLDSSDVDDIKEEISDVDTFGTLKESTQSHTSIVRDIPEPPKKIRTLLSDMVAGSMIEFLESRTRKKIPENAHSLFFKSLLADYEKLSSRRQRTFRLYMLNIMNELQAEEDNDAVNASDKLLTEAMLSAGQKQQQQQEYTSYSNTPLASCTTMHELSNLREKNRKYN